MSSAGEDTSRNYCTKYSSNSCRRLTSSTTRTENSGKSSQSCKDPKASCDKNGRKSTNYCCYGNNNNESTSTVVSDCGSRNENGDIYTQECKNPESTDCEHYCKKYTGRCNRKSSMDNKITGACYGRSCNRSEKPSLECYSNKRVCGRETNEKTPYQRPKRMSSFRVTSGNKGKQALVISLATPKCVSPVDAASTTETEPALVRPESGLVATDPPESLTGQPLANFNMPQGSKDDQVLSSYTTFEGPSSIGAMSLRGKEDIGFDAGKENTKVYDNTPVDHLVKKEESDYFSFKKEGLDTINQEVYYSPTTPAQDSLRNDSSLLADIISKCPEYAYQTTWTTPQSDSVIQYGLKLNNWREKKRCDTPCPFRLKNPKKDHEKNSKKHISPIHLQKRFYSNDSYSSNKPSDTENVLSSVSSLSESKVAGGIKEHNTEQELEEGIQTNDEFEVDANIKDISPNHIESQTSDSSKSSFDDTAEETSRVAKKDDTPPETFVKDVNPYQGPTTEYTENKIIDTKGQNPVDCEELEDKKKNSEPKDSINVKINPVSNVEDKDDHCEEVESCVELLSNISFEKSNNEGLKNEVFPDNKDINTVAHAKRTDERIDRMTPAEQLINNYDKDEEVFNTRDKRKLKVSFADDTMNENKLSDDSHQNFRNGAKISFPGAATTAMAEPKKNHPFLLPSLGCFSVKTQSTSSANLSFDASIDSLKWDDYDFDREG